jgi:DNA mismatch endonuclease (patch repair protein)
MPQTNRDYWEPKLAANVERDRETDAALTVAGWEVVRVWEHETSADAAALIASVVARRRGQIRIRRIDS